MSARRIEAGRNSNAAPSSDFHRISDELRNPLNAINGFAELLLMDETLAPDQAEMVASMLQEIQALTQLVVGYLEDADDRLH